MPTYCFDCKCGEKFEDIFSIFDDSSEAVCPKCGEFAEKDFVASMGGQSANVFESYYHVGHGKWVISKSQIKALDKERGVITPWVYDGCGTEIQGDKCNIKPWRDRPRKTFSLPSKEK